MPDTVVDAQASVITNVQITIDTDRLIKDYPNPSQDPGSPTGIAHNYQYMVVSGNEAINGQGTADLEFTAYPGDEVRFTMTSEYNNMDNPVLMYGITKFGEGTDVFGTFTSESATDSTPVPNGNAVVPPVYAEETFYYYQANVKQSGQEHFMISFAMYERVRGGGDPQLIGYFIWDPTITVK